ncbi:MAG: helix-turn-helix transcriptional regulator [Acidimicrobiales bacterium]
MRASRLLSLLLILQARGHATARELADELEVSVRTIYRDAEALQVAGIPLVGSAGPAGGYRLMQGYRTRLTGLTEQEASGLFFTGLPGPASDLGLGSAMMAAQLKLAAALPRELSDRAALVRDRFHLDTDDWYASRDPVPHLSAVAAAVWEQRRIRVRYRRWKDPDEVERVLDPYGIVLKAGHWYLVASSDGPPHTYRVSQLLELVPLDDTFERPASFDLARYWADYLREFHAHLYQSEATLRLSPAGRQRALSALSAAVNDAIGKTAGSPDHDGWIRAVVPIESVAHAEGEFLKLGADIEILAPESLRRGVSSVALRLARLYRLGPDGTSDHKTSDELSRKEDSSPAG